MKWKLGRTYHWLVVKLEFEPRDLWIGLRWDYSRIGTLRRFDVHICIVPTLPIHITHALCKLDK